MWDFESPQLVENFHTTSSAAGEAEGVDQRNATKTRPRAWGRLKPIWGRKDLRPVIGSGSGELLGSWLCIFSGSLKVRVGWVGLDVASGLSPSRREPTPVERLKLARRQDRQFATWSPEAAPHVRRPTSVLFVTGENAVRTGARREEQAAPRFDDWQRSEHGDTTGTPPRRKEAA